MPKAERRRKDLVRVQLDLTPELVACIDQAAEKLGETTRAAVIRLSLGLYLKLVDRMGQEVCLTLREAGVVIEGLPERTTSGTG